MVCHRTDTLGDRSRLPEEDDRMPEPRSGGGRPPSPDPAHQIAVELLGLLPFGGRAAALGRCPQLVEYLAPAGQVDGPPVPPEASCAAAGTTAGDRGATALVEAIDAFSGWVHVPDRYPEPLAPPLVRRMLHVLLATRDLGWPGVDAPLGVRRVAAADLFFDATQTVLSDDDWKGPDGVEFALLTALAGRVCQTAALRAAVEAEEGRAWDASGERLGHVHRVRRPRGL
jgi:hypothetical protein